MTARLRAALAAAMGLCVGWAQPAAAATGKCDASLQAAFSRASHTRVTQVMAFRKGDDLAPSMAEGKALEDICMVRLLVGPGNPGPADAPSTSPGIGIEVWLPSPARWNGRLHALGGGGMAGRLGEGTALAAIAGGEGAVSAFTDTGHASFIGTKFDFVKGTLDTSFLFNPDGKVSPYHWAAFGHLGIHEMAVQTKALARHYYGHPVHHAYFIGGSNGGRQGHVSAQAHPEDFDGIFSEAPAINWDKLMTSTFYPQLIMKRDLGRPLSRAQLALVSSSAISACDSTVTGEHDGVITDLAACRYDPVNDPTVLCASDGGSNATPDCLTHREAAVVNRIWYGQTADGHAPDPAVGNGYGDRLDPGQLWFGISRGAVLAGGIGSVADSENGAFMPFGMASRWLPVVLQDISIGPADVRNATGNGQDGWRRLDLADLVRAQTQSLELERGYGAFFGSNPDLRAFRARGGKLLVDHGIADQLIPLASTLDYMRRLGEASGGADRLGEFYRLFEVPGLGHGDLLPLVAGRPGISPPPDPLRPQPEQIYQTLVDWVENGRPPERFIATNKAGTVSRPLCPYPSKPAYLHGDKTKAENFTCR